MTRSTALHLIPLLPPFLIILVSIWTSFIFYEQGEADIQAPLFFGGGLAMIWRLKRSSPMNRIIRWVYLMTFSGFIIERSLPHAVKINAQWIDLEHSTSLLACGISLHLIGLIGWIIGRTQRSQLRSTHPSQEPQRSDVFNTSSMHNKHSDS